VIEKLRGLRLTNAAELVAAAIQETLAYYAFPEQHWRRIRTNSPLERIPRQIRRRTRVAGAFPTANPGSTSPPPGCAISPAPPVDQAISEHRAAEGPADERCHHRLRQRRAPLSPNQVCEIL
jgi:hypothetical protein